MLKIPKISRRSALKSLFVASVVPSIFLSSCVNNLNSPENVKKENSKLFKSSLNSEIGDLENCVVANNKNGTFEISKNYVHTYSNTYDKACFVLERVGTNNFTLLFKKNIVVTKGSSNNLVKISGINNGTVLIKTPVKAIKKLQKINHAELKRLFKKAKKDFYGGN